MRLIEGKSGRNWQPSVWIMALLTAATVGLIAATGGRASEFESLLFLPVLLAVIRFPSGVTVVASLTLTIVYLLLPSDQTGPPGIHTSDLIRVATLNFVALFGSMYARQVQAERDRLNVAVEEKDALLNVSQVVTSCDKLEYALNSALLLLRSIFPGVRGAAIYLTDEVRHHLIREADLGRLDLEDRIRVEELPRDWSLLAVHPHIAQPGQKLVLERGGPGGPGTRALVGLRSLNVPIGMLYVEFESAAPPDDACLRMLQGFAQRIGFPIHKIRMQEGLQSLAFTDPMTGLHNYRAFRATMEDEWKRAVRYRRPLSLILIDLDRFKEINDRYGHPAGDRLLGALADVLRDTVRETDIPARYGGEEFAVVCPETSEEDVFKVAERVRTAVESARFRLIEDEMTAITCSVGIATFPVHASTEEALIDAADSALYVAKRSGRNTVRSAASLPFLASETGT